MAHPNKVDSVENEARRIDRLAMPDAGAMSGEGRLEKMKLHEKAGEKEPAEPSGADEDADADEAEGDEE